MGGDLNQIEPDECSEFKNNGELWSKVIQGNLDSYVEGMTGHDPKLSTAFVQAWDNGAVKIGSITFVVFKVTGLALDGVAFHKKPKGNYKEDFSRFFEPVKGSLNSNMATIERSSLVFGRRLPCSS